MKEDALGVFCPSIQSSFYSVVSSFPGTRHTPDNRILKMGSEKGEKALKG